MYIARDKDGSLWLYEKKPARKDDKNWIANPIASNKVEELNLEEDWFPDVKWEDEEPKELILK